MELKLQCMFDLATELSPPGAQPPRTSGMDTYQGPPVSLWRILFLQVEVGWWPSQECRRDLFFRAARPSPQAAADHVQVMCLVVELILRIVIYVPLCRGHQIVNPAVFPGSESILAPPLPIFSMVMLG